MASLINLLFASSTAISACIPSTIYLPVTDVVTSTLSLHYTSYLTVTHSVSPSTTTVVVPYTSYLTVQNNPTTSDPTTTNHGPYSYYETSGSTIWLDGSPSSGASLVQATTAIYITPVPQGASLSPAMPTYSVPPFTSTTFVLGTETSTSTRTSYITHYLSYAPSLSPSSPSSATSTQLTFSPGDATTLTTTVHLIITSGVTVTTTMTREQSSDMAAPTSFSNTIPAVSGSASASISSSYGSLSLGSSPSTFAAATSPASSTTGLPAPGVMTSTNVVAPTANSSGQTSAASESIPGYSPVLASTSTPTALGTASSLATIIGSTAFSTAPSVYASVSASETVSTPAAYTLTPSGSLFSLPSYVTTLATGFYPNSTISSLSSISATGPMSMLQPNATAPSVSQSINASTATPSATRTQDRFTLTFDDLPLYAPLVQNQSDIMHRPPIGTGGLYNNLSFNGYVYAPSTVEPFSPISSPNVAVFLANATGMTIGSPSSTSGINGTKPGEINEPFPGNAAFYFNPYSMYVGCDYAGPQDCTMAMTGYTWSVNTEVPTFTHNVSLSPCQGPNCPLQLVQFPETFRGLSGLQLLAYTTKPVVFYMDNLVLGWDISA